MSVTTSGATGLAACPDEIWAALHDVDCLSRCIPRCQTLSRVSETRYDLTVQVGLGLVSMPVDGTVEILASDPCRRLHLKGTCRGLFGDAIGELRIDIAPMPRGCEVGYRAIADVRGLLATLGPTALTGVATALTDHFIRSLASWLTATPGAQSDASKPLPAAWMSSTMSSSV